MKKFIVLFLLFMLNGREAFSEVCRLAVVLDRSVPALCPGVVHRTGPIRSSVEGYGEPVLADSHAFWMYSVPEGTV